MLLFFQGRNAWFSATLLDYTDIFEIYPLEGRGTLTSSLLLKDASSLDFDEGIKTYTLRVGIQQTFNYDLLKDLKHTLQIFNISCEE